MTLTEVVKALGLEVRTGSSELDREVEGGYVSDLLSDVIANAGKDCVWVTMQTHTNILAVASLKDVGAIVVVSAHKPSDETITMAKQKGICVLGTGMPAFEICGKLYAAGIRASEG